MRRSPKASLRFRSTEGRQGIRGIFQCTYMLCMGACFFRAERSWDPDPKPAFTTRLASGPGLPKLKPCGLQVAKMYGGIGNICKVAVEAFVEMV